MKLEKSLNMLDQIIEKAEYDSYIDSIEEGFKHENFYLFNLKVLKKLIQEESSQLDE
tara:strand:- start:106 stop:276 length:171 start_codon:yes stop_codon:yes gene_type:complete